MFDTKQIKKLYETVGLKIELAIANVGLPFTTVLCCIDDNEPIVLTTINENTTDEQLLCAVLDKINSQLLYRRIKNDCD